MLNRNSKIYVAGHTGMVGSALIRILKIKGYKKIFIKTKKQLDLREQKKFLIIFIELNQMLLLYVLQKLEELKRIMNLKVNLFMTIYLYKVI